MHHRGASGRSCIVRLLTPPRSWSTPSGGAARRCHGLPSSKRKSRLGVPRRPVKPGTPERPVRDSSCFLLFTVAATTCSPVAAPQHCWAGPRAGARLPRAWRVDDRGWTQAAPGALRLAGVTQARAAQVLNARQTQLSAWMALGRGPEDVRDRLEAAFGFRTDVLVDGCPRRAGNVLCHRYKARGVPFCAACSMLVPGPHPVNGNGQVRGTDGEGEPSCVSCGRSAADQVHLRPARMLGGGGRVPLSAAAAVLICTHCRNAHRHQLHRCPDCDGWMRAGRDRCHRCVQ